MLIKVGRTLSAMLALGGHYNIPEVTGISLKLAKPLLVYCSSHQTTLVSVCDR